MVITIYVFFGFSAFIALFTIIGCIVGYKNFKNKPEPEPGTVVIRKNPVMFVAMLFIVIWACCFMFVALAFKDANVVAAVAVSAFFCAFQFVCTNVLKNILNWKVVLKDKGLVLRDMQRHVFEIPYEGLEYKTGMFGDKFYSRGRRVFGAGFVTEGIRVLKAVTESDVKELKPVLEKLAAESAEEINTKINRETEWQITSATAKDLELYGALLRSVKNAGRKDVTYLVELTKGENVAEVLHAIASTLEEWDDGEMQAVLIGVLANAGDPAYAFSIVKSVLKRGKEDTLRFGAIYEDALLKTWNDDLSRDYVRLLDCSVRLASLGKVAQRLAENKVFGIATLLSDFVARFVSYDAPAFDETDERAVVNAMRALAKCAYDPEVKNLLEKASYQTRSEKVYTSARELYFEYVPEDMA